MNKVTIKQRDRFSLEMKFRHIVQKHQKDRNYQYDISLYLFFPHTFNINPLTYERADFYEDLKLYLRFDTPEFRIDDLLDTACDTSPLIRMERMVHASRSGTAYLNGDEFIYETKLLGCIYKSLLRDSLNALRRSIRKSEGKLLVDKDIARTVRKLHGAAQRFHTLTAEFAETKPKDDLLQHCRMLDEHMSLLFEKYLTSFLEYCSPSGASDQYDKIVRLIVKEMRYRKKNSYPTVVESGTTNRKRMEEYVYREKMLKRYASEVLFFNVRRRDIGKGMEHLLYAAAAGIAMIFATTVAFFGQTAFGSLTLSLFILLVGSYMLKDRMKDMFRDWFRKSLGSRFFDHTINLYDSRHGKLLAKVKERVFFSSDKKLDERILTLRNRGPFEQALHAHASESILVYNKKIEIKSKVLHTIHNRITGLADIDIVNLEDFLRYLSTQYERIPFSISKNRIEIGRAKRMYHLNMIVHYHGPESDIIERRRIIVDSTGIDRIEETLP